MMVRCSAVFNVAIKTLMQFAGYGDRLRTSAASRENLPTCNLWLQRGLTRGVHKRTILVTVTKNVVKERIIHSTI